MLYIDIYEKKHNMMRYDILIARERTYNVVGSIINMFYLLINKQIKSY